jgi:hypothetical protein
MDGITAARAVGLIYQNRRTRRAAARGSLFGLWRPYRYWPIRSYVRRHTGMSSCWCSASATMSKAGSQFVDATFPLRCTIPSQEDSCRVPWVRPRISKISGEAAFGSGQMAKNNAAFKALEGAEGWLSTLFLLSNLCYLN